MAITVELTKGKTVEIASPERSQFSDDLSGGIQFALANTLFKVLEIMGEGAGSFVGSFLVRFLEIIEPELVDYVSPLIDLILAQEDVPEEVTAFLQSIQNPEHEAGTAFLAGLGTTAGGTIVGSVLNSLLAPVTYGINQKIRPARPGVGETIGMFYRGELDEATLQDWLKDQGYPDPAIKGFLTLLRPRLSPVDLIAWAWREHGELSSLREELLKRGFEGDEADKILTLGEYIPSPDDLVRMAVREAFTPSAISAFGLMEDLPAEFTKWAKKKGMSAEWAQRYWAAHWNLPSPNMVFEMFQRGIVEQGVVSQYLKTADYSSYWREKLIQLAYSVYTRVDVRRMFKLGILSYDQVVKSYKDLGYPDDKARNLAEFTKLEYADEEREVTKADIIGALKDGLIGSGDAASMLDHVGYAPEQISILIQRAEYAIAKEGQAAKIAAAKAAYIKGKTDINGARGALGQLNLSASHADALLSEWQLEMQSKVTLPTVGDLGEMYTNDVISEAVYSDLMTKRGYLPEHISYYRRMLLTDKAELVKKEAQRLQLEQQRVTAQKVRNELAIAKANLDVQIATADLDIVEGRLALIETTDEAQAAQLSNLIGQARILKAQLKVTKAGLPIKYPPPTPVVIT